MDEQLLKRSEVPVELTWDITRLYKTEDDMKAALNQAVELSASIKANYSGKLTDAVTINSCLDDLRTFSEIVEYVYHYVDLPAATDHTDAYLQERVGSVGGTLVKCNAELSFINSELISVDSAILEEAMKLSGDNRTYIADILREKPHQLSPEAEQVLAALSQTFETPYSVYQSAKLADMDFGTFSVDGREYPLGYSLFEDDYEYHSDANVRRAAFEAFSKKLAEYKNVTATAYNACVRYEKTMADLRGFDSVFDYLLFYQQIETPAYNLHLDTIMEELAPHMRKYAKLVQKVHGLSEMTFADLKVPLDSEYDVKISIEESKKYIENGLAVMGEDYVEMCRTAYRDRWVDFVKNIGKGTGGFCASPYRKGSYILFSWNDRMSDLLTLAHELGHAGHFKTCSEAQSIFAQKVSTYFVEAPSTINELFMSHYLLTTSDDKRFRRYVLSSIISNTYYHNFVTHFLEAYYQREVYRIIDAGGSVQADTLSRIMRETLEKFWGDAVVIPEGAELTWMRQPHYYMGLYSYTYSAGLSIATEVCNRIETEGQAAVDDWKKVLAAGSTKNPLDLAEMAGVNMRTPEPVKHTIATIGKIIDEICELSE